jgi:hypothetical protein
MMMSIRQTIERLDTRRRNLRLNWWSIALFAVVIAYADGFWLTSLQGAIGAIERTQSRFWRWLRDSTFMLPFFVLAVAGAVILARRWLGPSRRGLSRVVLTVGLIVGITCAVSIVEAAASSVYDYQVQSRHLVAVHALHVHPLPAQVDTTGQVTTPSCVGLCQARRSTLMAHVRGVSFGSALFLLTNIVIAAWLLALRGAKFWRPEEDASVPVARDLVDHASFEPALV